MWKTVQRRSRLAIAASILAATVSTLVLQSPAGAAPEGPAEVVTAAQVSALKAASYGGDVSRATVIARGKDWYDRNVPYNQGATAWDENHGKRYRTDCSGFISMAWKLTSSLTTSTLDNVSHVINWNDLLPGDALVHPGSHAQLFVKWADSSTKADFYVYEEGSTASDMNYLKIHVVTSRKDGYKPYRYDNIVR